MYLRSVVLVSLFAATVAMAAGTPVPPYPAPVTGYVGRYVDSPVPLSTTAFLYNPRLARELNLLIQVFGYRFSAYDLATFPQRVASGPYVTLPNGERYLQPDLFFDADAPGSGASLPGGPHGASVVDYLPTGNFFLGYKEGVIILDSAGHFAGQIVVASTGRIGAFSAGAHQYLLVQTNQNALLIYEVTNPAAPVQVATLPTVPFRQLARTSTTVAVSGGILSLYDPATLAAGGSPRQVINPSAGTGTFATIDTDGTRFFVLGQTGTPSGYVNVFTPDAGGSFALTKNVPITTTNGQGQLTDICYGSGYVTTGAITDGPFVMAIDTPVTTPYNLGPYLRSTYGNHPGLVEFDWALPFDTGGTTYLAGSFGQIGDLFVLAPAVSGAAVPALGPWMIALLGLMLAIAALVKLNR
jgi:hypothetical protein